MTHWLEVTHHRNGYVQIMNFATALSRALVVIALAKQPVTLRVWEC